MNEETKNEVQEQVIEIDQRQSEISITSQQNNMNSPIKKNKQNSSPEYKEPITHVQNKDFAEKYCMGKKNDLTNQEIKSFVDFRDQCNILFDNDNPEHNDMVCKLWYTITENNIQIDEINNDQWKLYGQKFQSLKKNYIKKTFQLFQYHLYSKPINLVNDKDLLTIQFFRFQNKNPRTDFRGAGIMGLKNIVNFVNRNSGYFKEMTKPENEFLFAISSINVSYFLMQYFHLFLHLDIKKDKKVICGRNDLKNFCRLLCQNEILFFDLHGLILVDLFNQWQQFKKKEGEKALLLFGDVQESNKQKFKRIFKKKEYKTYQDFSNNFLKDKN